MPTTLKRTIEGVDWQSLSALYAIAPLGDKKPADLETVFTNSRYVCFAMEAGKLVGAGRVLADGVDCAYVCDIAVHPACQGTGLGKQILTDLVARSRQHRKIILYSVPGKEGFYAAAGFRSMTTAMAIFSDQARAVRDGYLADT